MDTNYSFQISVLADDLTSAADGAAPFVTHGLTASVGRGRLPDQAANVIAVDSGTRSLNQPQAINTVARLTSQLASRPLLYKTVDSTLRGHVAAELAACFKASGRKSLVFAPAFPAAGRTTVAGVQLVDGVPVSESVYGRDPRHPARHSMLADLIPDGIQDVILLNAETQEELDTQIAAIDAPETILWAGSPGMAMALAKRFAPPEGAHLKSVVMQGDVLVAVGTANPRSHRQASFIQHMDGVTLRLAPTDPSGNATRILHDLAVDTASALQDARFGALIATGGDTLEAILDLVNVQMFEILQELDQGFPLGRAILPDGRSLLMAMKAGGFGSDDVLVRAIQRLRCMAHPLQKEME